MTVGGVLFKVKPSGRRKKIPRGAPLKKITGHRCPFETYLNSSLLKSYKPPGPCNQAPIHASTVQGGGGGGGGAPPH